ncbi:MAG: MgtC/SapB family protein [Casimicrobiaceae bacterium]
MTETEILQRCAAAMLCGALVGIERTYRGRAAGLRTYTLVALGASLLVASTEYGGGWVEAGVGHGDPTRVIQGIVTGIGFLGAGVIIREGFSVRGLTTAAAVWVTAAIGISLGTGLYAVGAAATAASWVALELLHQVENRVPVRSLVHCELVFARANAWDEHALRVCIQHHGFRLDEISYGLDPAMQTVAYDLVIWSRHAGAAGRLQHALVAEPAVIGFRISPGRD